MRRFGFRRLSALLSRDDAVVRTRQRFLSILPAAACLLAVVVHGVAAALPFLEAPTYGGLSGCCGPQTTQLVHSLFQGYDAGWVVVLLLILAVTAAPSGGNSPSDRRRLLPSSIDDSLGLCSVRAQ
jgi:hypothetical protein